MIDPTALKPGDVLDYWHESGLDGGDLCYARVVRLTPHFVVFESERGGERRVSKYRVPGVFENVLKPHEWSPWNPGGR